MSERDIDTSSENVLSDWVGTAEDDDDESEVDEPAVEPRAEALAEEVSEADALDEKALDEEALDEEDGAPAWGTAPTEAAVGPVEEQVELVAAELAVDTLDEAAVEEAEVLEAGALEAEEADDAVLFPVELSHEHAAGDLHIPDGYAVLEGAPEGGRRAVGIVVARFNGQVTTRLLDRALEELTTAGVRQEAITIMVVPGAFELPLAATALADGGTLARWMLAGEMPQAEALRSDGFLLAVLVAASLYVPVMMGFWFAPVLAAWHGIGAPKALFFSLLACLMNWRAFLAYGIAAALLLLVMPLLTLSAVVLLTHGGARGTVMSLVFPLVIVLLPTLFASFYASYRDVFGGEPSQPQTLH